VDICADTLSTVFVCITHYLRITYILIEENLKKSWNVPISL